MNEDRRKAEELVNVVFPMPSAESQEWAITKVTEAIRQARLEENKACEEICINTCSRVCTKSIDDIAKRRGEE